MTGKAKRVHERFSSIAPGYDLLNTLLSLNQDRHWRRFAVERSGELAIELAKAGLKDIEIYSLTEGIVSVHIGIKPT